MNRSKGPSSWAALSALSCASVLTCSFESVPRAWYAGRRTLGIRVCRSVGSGTINPYLAQVTFTFIQILTWAIIARALISWLPIDQSSPLYQALMRATEPIIDPIRRVLPNTGMMDLSPLATILVLLILGQTFAHLATLE